jgi:hypothetical protein
MEHELSPKDRLYQDVLNSAIELDIKKGHLKWTYSELSRVSKVTRSLIYYYFGKSKVNILLEACHFFGRELSGNSEVKLQDWKEGRPHEGIIKSKQMLKKLKMIIPFYFLYRDADNEIGELIRHYERMGIRKRRNFYPNLPEDQIEALYALQLGLSFCPHLKLKWVETGFQLIDWKKLGVEDPQY